MLARLTMLGIAASVLTIAPAETAIAAESIPNLQWPAVDIGNDSIAQFVESPTGDITVSCGPDRDLQTRTSTGQVIRTIDRTSQIDNISNCIVSPVIDKNNDLYGLPSGDINGMYSNGPNLLAYNNVGLKWKYPIRCSQTRSSIVVGANGNIYATNRDSSGKVRLIGLTPDAEPNTAQPKKILDIAIPNDCSINLYPYKDGIMVHGQSSDLPLFYNYNGTQVGTSPIGDVWSEKINADGYLFVAKQVYVSSTVKSGVIETYNPRTNTVQSTVVSTSGANVDGISIHPLANGGAVAVVREQKVIGGIPTIPSEKIQKLITINSTGAITNTTEIGSSYSQNNLTGTFHNFSIHPDSNGKIAVVREMSLNTGLSSPQVMPAIMVGLYDPVNSVWDYESILHGDLNKVGGPNGWAPGSFESIVVTNNTISLAARCLGNCSSYNYMLYSFETIGVGARYPAMDVISSEGRPATKYIALGDSFSSGEGVPPFEADTNTPDVNTCHRSTVAYPRIIAGSNVSIPALSEDSFRACSGAITANVTDIEQWNENIQLDWRPDATTEVVTITIGGNDIGFGSFAEACVLSSCDTGTAAYNSTLNKINNELPGKLEATYKNILRYTPNAKIYVAGYPQVVADKSVNDPDDIRCVYMQDGSSKFGDARAARSIVTKLNEKIADTISSVRGEDVDNLRLRFVDVNQTSSPFAGHEVCGYSPTSWFQNVDQGTNDYAYIFHPNELGQEAYATIIGAAISAG